MATVTVETNPAIDNMPDTPGIDSACTVSLPNARPRYWDLHERLCKVGALLFASLRLNMVGIALGGLIWISGKRRLGLEKNAVVI